MLINLRELALTIRFRLRVPDLSSNPFNYYRQQLKDKKYYVYKFVVIFQGKATI